MHIDTMTARSDLETFGNSKETSMARDPAKPQQPVDRDTNKFIETISFTIRDRWRELGNRPLTPAPISAETK